jgi:hypothetical protein
LSAGSSSFSSSGNVILDESVGLAPIGPSRIRSAKSACVVKNSERLKSKILGGRMASLVGSHVNGDPGDRLPRSLN